MLKINAAIAAFVFCILSFQFSQAQDQQTPSDTLATDSVQINKYDELIKKSITSNGLLNVIQSEGDFYFEVNDSLLGKDLLIVSKISQVPYALNGHGLNKGMAFETKLIRFYKDTLLSKMWVKTLDPKIQFDPEDAISQSVKDNFGESILEEFKIEMYNNDSTASIIKVNKVFDGSRKTFSDIMSNTGLGASIQTDLSKIEKIKTFPENVVVKSTLTTSISEGGPAMPLSIGITINIVLLPEETMKPRFEDKRVGFFTIPMHYYADEQQHTISKQILTRWRLEPKSEDIEKYKKGELVAPAKPIVFYIDPATPPQWKPYIEAGILDWNKAFEQAGFKNAIEVIIPKGDDPNFDPDDIRYSVVTYAASEQQNAMGPSIVDPRSGEILEADIMWWHNVMAVIQKWMRVQTGLINPDAQGNELPEALMGEGIRFVASHELGHTLGLPHNMIASHSYPVDSLRSQTFTKRVKGTAPSIMDYARYNYIAQPEDSVEEISPQIGVYDLYAIDWGYRWLDTTPEDEWPILNEWIKQHENDPRYRFGAQQPATVDPRSQSEDLGDNAVKASEYGLKNLKRMLPLVISWTAEEGKDYYQSAKLYKAIIDQWVTYNSHVMANIGGVYINNTVYGDGQNSYASVPSALQRDALNYIIANAIAPQEWLFTPELIKKTYAVRDAPDGERYYSAVSLMRQYQANSLYAILKQDRLARIEDNLVLDTNEQNPFTAHEIYDALFDQIFMKTKKGKALSLYDRMSQKNYVDVLSTDRLAILKKTKENTLEDPAKEFTNIHFTYMPRIADMASGKYGELQRILKLLKKKRNTGDRASKEHYEDLIARIEYNLNH